MEFSSFPVRNQGVNLLPFFGIPNSLVYPILVSSEFCIMTRVRLKTPT